MNRYELTVTSKVVVESFDEADAVEVVEDAMGEGDYGGYLTVDMRVTQIREV